MDKVLINNNQGENGIVNVVRYFKSNGMTYLIYTLNETDDASSDGVYVKLYIAKITNENGIVVANTISDENEWTNVKELIRNIVRSIRSNQPVPVEDLDIRLVPSIDLRDKRVFKLNENLVNVLSSNKPNFNDNSIPNLGGVPNFNTTSIPDTTPIPDVPNFNNFRVPDVNPQPNMQTGNIFDMNPQMNAQPDFSNMNMGVSDFQNVGSNLNSAPIPEVSNQNMNFGFESTPNVNFETPNQNITHINSFDDLISNPQTSNITSSVNNAMDYKKLYEEELKKSQSLEMELNQYKNKIESLKTLLNQ